LCLQYSYFDLIARFFTHRLYFSRLTSPVELWLRLPITGSLASGGESGKWKSFRSADVAWCLLVCAALLKSNGSRDLLDGILNGFPICGEIKSRTKHQSDVRRWPWDSGYRCSGQTMGQNLGNTSLSGVKHAERESRYSQPTRFFQDSYRHPDS
jgi:hypothetical protein